MWYWKKTCFNVLFREMCKKIRLVFKICLFVLIFYVLSVVVAFVLRDDYSSYARVLMHEFYGQENIDILYCGASHVSHGVSPKIADEITGKNNFCSGTASQTIEGTYAILRQAVKKFKIEKVFLEMDFAVSCKPANRERVGFSADYLVSQYIKDPLIKIEYLASISSPKYYINHFLPIGKDKYITLKPKDLFRKIKGFVNGQYFKYGYDSDDSEYDGKGCVLDLEYIKSGSFVNYIDEGRIQIEKISDEWKKTIDKIIDLCRKNNIELIFYSMPCSDFYLAEKGNYDEYYEFCRNFLNERGFEYYDFNLAKENFMKLDDDDFSDDNHFCKKGVYKWTKAFCTCFFSGISKEDLFYGSYAEKIASQGEKIYGLLLKTSADKKSINITPVKNHVSDEKITYDVYSIIDGQENLLYKDTKERTVMLPQEKSGEIRVLSYIDGIIQNDCTVHFTSF